MAAPILVSSNPNIGGVINPNDDITLTFSEQISLGAGAITIYEIGLGGDYSTFEQFELNLLSVNHLIKLNLLIHF